MKLRGVVVGALGLAALQMLVANRRANEGLGGAFGAAAGLVSALMDPSKPGLPDLRSGGGGWGLGELARKHQPAGGGASYVRPSQRQVPPTPTLST